MFNLDKHIHKCIISFFSLHKALTQCKNPPSYLDILIPNLKACLAAVLWSMRLHMALASFFEPLCFMWLNLTEFTRCYGKRSYAHKNKRENMPLLVYSFELFFISVTWCHVLKLWAQKHWRQTEVICRWW